LADDSTLEQNLQRNALDGLPAVRHGRYLIGAKSIPGRIVSGFGVIFLYSSLVPMVNSSLAGGIEAC
jgi:hypothetical protein